MKNLSLSFLSFCLCLSSIQAQTDTIVSKFPQNKNVLLEEFTGVKCGNCPDAHRIANELKTAYPDRFICFNIHTSSFAVPDPGDPDFRTDFGDALQQNAQITALPSGTINRHLFPGSVLALAQTEWKKYSQTIMETEACANIAARATIDWNNRELRVETQIFYTGNANSDTNYLHVALLQNHILGPQKNGFSNPEQYANGSYIHNHVLRDLLTGLWGEAITETEQGSFITRTLTKKLPEKIRNIDLNLAELELAVFLTESRNEVIQACQAPIQHIGPDYVFLYANGRQLEELSCDGLVRVGFELKNLNFPGKELIETIGFHCVSGDKESEFTVSVKDSFLYQSTMEICSEPVLINRIGQKDTIEIAVNRINGTECQTEGLPSIKIPVIKYLAFTASPVVTVNLYQDGFGSETQWHFTDQKGNVLGKGGPYPDIPLSETRLHTYEIPISNGCYTFTVTDSEGDGINNGFGQGHFNLSDAEGNILIAHDGNFTDSVSLMLKKTDVGNQKRGTATFLSAAIYPNPSEGQAWIRIQSPKDDIVNIRISDISGKLLTSLERRIAKGENILDLPVRTLISGLYLVRIQGTETEWIGKCIIRR